MSSPIVAFNHFAHSIKMGHSQDGCSCLQFCCSSCSSSICIERVEQTSMKRLVRGGPGTLWPSPRGLEAPGGLLPVDMVVKLLLPFQGLECVCKKSESG